MLRRTVIILFLLAVSLGAAQTTDGSKSGIRKSDLAKVRKTKYRVLVPTYVPSGFVVKDVGLSLDKEKALTTWIARYENPKSKATFYIQMASDGLGDPMFDMPNGDVVEPTGSIPGKSLVFGKFDLMFVRKNKIKMAACTWYEVSKRTFPSYAMVYSDGLDASTVKRVIENLRWLN